MSSGKSRRAAKCRSAGAWKTPPMRTLVRRSCLAVKAAADASVTAAKASPCATARTASAIDAYVTTTASGTSSRKVCASETLLVAMATRRPPSEWMSKRNGVSLRVTIASGEYANGLLKCRKVSRSSVLPMPIVASSAPVFTPSNTALSPFIARLSNVRPVCAAITVNNSRSSPSSCPLPSMNEKGPSSRPCPTRITGCCTIHCFSAGLSSTVQALSARAERALAHVSNATSSGRCRLELSTGGTSMAQHNL